MSARNATAWGLSFRLRGMGSARLQSPFRLMPALTLPAEAASLRAMTDASLLDAALAAPPPVLPAEAAQALQLRPGIAVAAGLKQQLQAWREAA